MIGQPRGASGPRPPRRRLLLLAVLLMTTLTVGAQVPAVPGSPLPGLRH